LELPAFKRSRSTTCYYDNRVPAWGGEHYHPCDGGNLEALEALRNHISKEQLHYGIPRSYCDWLERHPTLKRLRDGAVRWFIKVHNREIRRHLSYAVLPLAFL